MSFARPCSLRIDPGSLEEQPGSMARPVHVRRLQLRLFWFSDSPAVPPSSAVALRRIRATLVCSLGNTWTENPCTASLPSSSLAHGAASAIF